MSNACRRWDAVSFEIPDDGTLNPRKVRVVAALAGGNVGSFEMELRREAILRDTAGAAGDQETSVVIQ